MIEVYAQAPVKVHDEPSPVFGVSADELAARIGAAFGPCQHEHTVPVDLVVTGEVVAALCEDCLTRLPASWGCQDCEYVDDVRLCEPTPRRVMVAPCARHTRPMFIRTGDDQ